MEEETVDENQDIIRVGVKKREDEEEDEECEGMALQFD